MFTVSKSGDLSGIAAELERAAIKGQRDAGRAIAKDARKVILDDVRGARGSLSMMGGRLGVKSRVTATQASSEVELYAAPAGPWTIVTQGTRPYDIEPRRRKVLAAGKGDVIGMHAHRGRRPGRDYWAQATARLDSVIGDIVADTIDAAMSAV